MDAIPRYVAERRRAARHEPAADSLFAVRVRPGHDADVLNISTVGALIETACRLLPGTFIEIQLSAADRRTTIRARVVRSWVSRLLPGHVRYRGGVGFDLPVPWLSEACRSGHAIETSKGSRFPQSWAYPTQTKLDVSCKQDDVVAKR